MLNAALSLISLGSVILLSYFNHKLIQQDRERNTAFKIMSKVLLEMRNCQNCKHAARSCDDIFEECFSKDYKHWEMVNVDPDIHVEIKEVDE